jgi:hypothetical protein
MSKRWNANLPETSSITQKVSAVPADVAAIFPNVSTVLTQVAAVFSNFSSPCIAALCQGGLLYCHEDECQTAERNPGLSFHRFLLSWKWVRST